MTRVAQLNQAIEVGLDQLARGEKVEGSASYQKMKSKIKRAAKSH